MHFCWHSSFRCKQVKRLHKQAETSLGNTLDINETPLRFLCSLQDWYEDFYGRGRTAPNRCGSQMQTESDLTGSGSGSGGATTSGEAATSQEDSGLPYMGENNWSPQKERRKVSRSLQLLSMPAISVNIIASIIQNQYVYISFPAHSTHLIDTVSFYWRCAFSCPSETYIMVLWYCM